MDNKTLDIIQIVENSPLTRFGDNVDYSSKLVDKLRDKFSTEEEQLFLASFYCYLNYDKHDFLIDLNQIWKWIGFSRMEEAKRLLKKHFTDGSDYKVLLRRSAEQKGRGGHNAENTFLTVNCFKRLCLKARTDKADQIHNYYIRLEEIYQEILEEDVVKLRDQFIDENNLEQKNIDITKYSKKPVLYILKIGEDLYKYGYTEDIETRLTTHRNKITPDLKIIRLYILKTPANARKVESCITKYAKTLNINSSFGDAKREIVKCSIVYINLILKKISYWISKYDKTDLETQKQILDSKLELVNKQLLLVNTLLDAGVEANKVVSFIMPKVQELEQIQLKTPPKPPKPFVVPEGTKCFTCGQYLTDVEMGKNPVTKQLYSSCKTCRKKVSDRTLELSREEREKAEKEFKEKRDKIDQQRTKILESKELKCCFWCKKDKLPKKFGVSKITNNLYKVCIECKEERKTEASDTNEVSDATEETEANEAVEASECSKCKKQFKADINPISRLNYRTCKTCRDKDKKVHENAKKTPVHECNYCHKKMEPSINPANKKYYKNCQECRDKRKKYDKKKNEKNKEKICKQKKEYYQKNRDDIRRKQKEYYDENN